MTRLHNVEEKKHDIPLWDKNGMIVVVFVTAAGVIGFAEPVITL